MGFAKRPVLVESEIGDDLLIFDAARQRFFALNYSAKIAWKVYFTSADVKNVMEALAVAFRVKDGAQLEKDVTTFLHALAGAGLLEEDRGQRADDDKAREYIRVAPLEGQAYVAPGLREIPLEVLEKKHPDAVQDVMFFDVWKPTGVDVDFLDTWRPSGGSLSEAAFLDVWQTGHDVAFLDTWSGTEDNLNLPGKK